MANLIAKLARQSDLRARSGSLDLSQLSSNQDPLPNFSIPPMTLTSCSCTCSGNVHLTLTKPQDVVLDVEFLGSRGASAESGRGVITYEHDEQPLQEERDWGRMGRRRSQLSYV